MPLYRSLLATVLLASTTGCSAQLSTLVCSPPQAAEFFAPERPIRVDDGLAQYLWSIGEPSLWRKRLEPGVEAYRLILVPSFERKRMVVRIELDDSTVSVVRPERTWCTRKHLPGEQAVAMRRQIDRMSFWEMSPDKPHRMMDFVLDGTLWVVEGVKNGNYHVIVRSSPDAPWNCDPEQVDVAFQLVSRRSDQIERSAVEEYFASKRRLAEFGQFVSETVGIDGWTIEACRVDEAE